MAEGEQGEQAVVVVPEALVAPEAGAIHRAWSGGLTDADSRHLRRKVFNITPEEELAIDTIVQSPLTSYGSFSEFIRHWAIEGVYAWLGAGFPDNRGLGETLEALRKARQHSQRLQLRGQFEENLKVSEDAIADWIRCGDHTAILKELYYLDGLVKQTQDLSDKWAWRIEAMILDSDGVRRGVRALYEAWYNGTAEQQEEAKKWTDWLEALT